MYELLSSRWSQFIQEYQQFENIIIPYELHFIFYNFNRINYCYYYF